MLHHLGLACGLVTDHVVGARALNHSLVPNGDVELAICLQSYIRPLSALQSLCVAILDGNNGKNKYNSSCCINTSSSNNNKNNRCI